MIHTPHQDKGLHNANASDFGTALNLVHYGPNLGNYDISYVQWSENGAYRGRRRKSFIAITPSIMSFRMVTRRSGG